MKLLKYVSVFHSLHRLIVCDGKEEGGEADREC